MFAYCECLKDINSLQNWNVSNGNDFSSMFAHCEQLKSIQLPITLQNIDKYIFEGCNKDLKIKWKNHVYTLEDLNTYEQFWYYSTIENFDSWFFCKNLNIFLILIYNTTTINMLQFYISEIGWLTHSNTTSDWQDVIIVVFGPYK